MVTINVDKQVFEKLQEIAIPFVEITPNMVIRRLLGLPNDKLVKVVLSSDNGKISSKLTGDSEKGSALDNDIKSSSRDIGISVIKSEKPRNKRRIIQQPIIDREEYPFLERIEKLREDSYETHPAFLTFLMDKYYNTKGNYQTKQIMDFMEKMNLKSLSGVLRNPWMKGPYSGDKNGITSCQRTIEHFKQTRKFGCWGGKNNKQNCDASDICQYHPDNKSEIKNKCDLRKGVIWTRNNPGSSFTYGTDYLKVVKNELLKGKTIPLRSLLNVFYPNRDYSERLIDHFIRDFHINDRELTVLFTK